MSSFPNLEGGSNPIELTGRTTQWPLFESDPDAVSSMAVNVAATTSACTSTQATSSNSSSSDKGSFNKLVAHQEADIGIRIMQRDLHDDRMNRLRQLAKELDQDDWLYPSVDEIFGWQAFIDTISFFISEF